MEEDQVVAIIGRILQDKPELAPSVVAFAVPDLTYAPSRALAERRSKGVVKSFNQEKGFGYIACPELKAVFGNDVYVHAKQIAHMCQPGTEVSFAVLLNKENKPQAFDVQPAAGGAGANVTMAKATAIPNPGSAPPPGMPMPPLDPATLAMM